MTVAHPKVGNDCSLYINGGTLDIPAWIELQAISDVSISTLEVSMAEVVTRSSDWAVNLAAKFRAELEFRWLWGEDKENLEALIMAFFSRLWMDMLVMDNDLTAIPPMGEGLRGPFFITQMPRSEPNEEAVTVDMFRLTPALAYDTEDDNNTIRHNPVWYIIATAQQLEKIGGPGFASPSASLQGKLKTSIDPGALQKLQRTGRLQFESLETVSAKEAVTLLDGLKKNVSNNLRSISRSTPHKAILVPTRVMSSTPKKSK